MNGVRVTESPFVQSVVAAGAPSDEQPMSAEALKAEIKALTEEVARLRSIIPAPTASDQRKDFDTTKHPCWSPARIVDAKEGIVELARPRDKVAIVGFASSTRAKAPFDDPSFEVWGLNQLYGYIPRWERWFEMHARPIYEADQVRDSEYPKWLQKCPTPVYMLQPHLDIPNSVQFPLKRAMDLLMPGGVRDDQPLYITSTPTWCLILALLEGFKEIHIYGIDLIVGKEYDYQKACTEFWIGVARGRGVRVYLPPESALCRSTYVYGPHVEGPPPFGALKRKFLENQLAHLRKQHNEELTRVNALEGGIGLLEKLMELHMLAEHGGAIPQE